MDELTEGKIQTLIVQASSATERIAEHQAAMRHWADTRRAAVTELATVMTYREIAQALGVSEPLVSRIMGKGWGGKDATSGAHQTVR